MVNGKRKNVFTMSELFFTRDVEEPEEGGFTDFWGNTDPFVANGAASSAAVAASAAAEAAEAPRLPTSQTQKTDRELRAEKRTKLRATIELEERATIELEERATIELEERATIELEERLKTEFWDDMNRKEHDEEHDDEEHDDEEIDDSEEARVYRLQRPHPLIQAHLYNDEETEEGDEEMEN